MISDNRTSNIIGAIVSVVILIVFSIWLFSTELSRLQLITSIPSVLLFALLVFRTIAFMNNTQMDLNSSGETGNVKTGLPLILSIVWALGINIFLLLASNGEYPSTDSQVLRLILNQDIYHYEQIAENWYTPEALSVFPLYPILVGKFNFINDFWKTSVIFSSLFAILASIALYHLALVDASRTHAMRTVRYLLILPSTFLLILPLHDSLFLLFSVLFIYFSRRKFYFNAFMSGFCAALCSFQAILLIIPAVMEIIFDYLTIKLPKVKYNQDSYTALESASNITVEELMELYSISKQRVPFYRTNLFHSLHVLGLLLGFITFLYINHMVSGNAFHFIEENPTICFWNAPAYFVQNATEWAKINPHYFQIIYLPNLISFFGVLIFLLLGSGRIRSSLMVYSILLFVFAFSTQNILAAPRLISVLFPLAFIASSYSKNRSIDILLSTIFIACFSLCFFVFIVQLI